MGQQRHDDGAGDGDGSAAPVRLRLDQFRQSVDALERMLDV
jgi:hypothetical protein